MPLRRHGLWPPDKGEHARENLRTERGTPPGQIVWTGVTQDQPPGRSLAGCRMVPAVLDHLVPEDRYLAHRNRSEELKWARLTRFAAGAYYQGACLNQPDLAFLLGISVDAVRSAMEQHPKVILPTRGRLAGMDPTLSHAEKIAGLYMQGHTETPEHGEAQVGTVLLPPGAAAAGPTTNPPTLEQRSPHRGTNGQHFQQ